MNIRLNSILIILDLVVLIFFFLADKRATYLYGSEAQVYLLLTVTLASLVINSRFKNEFLDVLNVVFVGFYICRIPFIFFANVGSDVTQRDVDISQIPWGIIILTFQYLSLVFCVMAINPKIPRQYININCQHSEFIFKRLLIFSFLIIIVNAMLVTFWFDLRVQTLSHIPAILKTIFTIKAALMLIILSSILVGKNIFLKYKYFIAGCFILSVGVITFQGGKAIVLTIILMVFLAMVVVHDTLVFRLRGLLIAAGIIFGAFGMYLLGAAFRIYQVGQNKDLSFILRIIYEKTSFLDLLSAISYRIGYFDFFIEKISNPVYEPFVSFTYYFKALLDKVTPGFDVFGVPFMSRALYGAYHGDSPINNSEFITIFGEGHLLLGFFSFCLFLPLLFLIKYALSNYRTSSGIANAIFYMFVIYMFYFWLTGMGLDMLVAFIIYNGIFVLFTIGLIGWWYRGKTGVMMLSFFRNKDIIRK
jgi:hypothetical protein